MTCDIAATSLPAQRFVYQVLPAAAVLPELAAVDREGVQIPNGP